MTILNKPPVVIIEQVTTDLGDTNLTNAALNIIEYSTGLWDWEAIVDDDDILTINYTFFNSTGSIVFTNISNTPIDIFTANLTFIDFTGNPYNFTVTAQDTFGNITIDSIEFNVTDTTNPACTGFNNASVRNQSTFTFDVTCTDEAFFELNVSCNNTFSSLDTGLQTTRFLYTQSFPFNQSTLCNITFCDGHTDKWVDDILITQNNSHWQRSFDSKIVMQFHDEVIEFNSTKMLDRYNFNVRYYTTQSKYINFTITSDEYIWIMDGNKHKGWLITGDYWIDFDSNDVKLSNAYRVSDTEVIVELKLKKDIDVIEFNSIGKLNCVSTAMTLTLLPTIPSPINFTLQRFDDCDVSNTDKSIFIIGIIFLFVFLWMFSIHVKIPILSIFIGFLMAYFGWAISHCWEWANVLFIILGMFAIGQGIVEAVTKKGASG